MREFFSKHTPKTLDDIVSNKRAILEIKNWSKNYKQGPLFIYGPPGVGKTLATNLLAKEMGWDISDTDATDIRDKETIKHIMSVATTTNNLFGKTRLILVDEVDAIIDKRKKGGDSGFFREFNKIVAKATQPIVFIANDPYENKKIRPLYEKSIKVKFDLPNKLSIQKFAKEICDKENVEYDVVSIKELVENSGNDIRAMMNDLYTLSLNKKITLEDVNSLGDRKKDEDVFKALTKIFHAKDFYETKNAIQNSNINWDSLFLWVEENLPRQYKNIDNLVEGFENLSKADLYYGRIRGNRWGLLKYVIDYLTIGVGYSKKEKEFSGYQPYQFPIALRKLTTKERQLLKTILLKLKRYIKCSKKKLAQEYIPIIRILLQKQEYLHVFIHKYGLNVEELKYLGAKITPKKYDKILSGL
jgi:replication factor C large subunit